MFTVAIPTFNRNALLAKSVESVLSQMSSSHKLLIVDNKSEIPAVETLSNLISINRECNVKVIENVANIGGAANLLRCMEYCEDDWMYCLGDDDCISGECLQIIDKTISLHGDAMYVSFSRSGLVRSESIVSQGLNGFVDALDDWSSFLFMSSVIINVRKIRPYLRYGYLYAYSWAPFQAMLIMALRQGGEVVFSNQVICNEAMLGEETWNPLTVATGKLILLELIEKEELRFKLFQKITKRPRSIYLAYLASTENINSQYALYVFRLYVVRSGTYAKFLTRFVNNILLGILKTPRPLQRMAQYFVEVICKRKGIDLTSKNKISDARL